MPKHYDGFSHIQFVACLQARSTELTYISLIVSSTAYPLMGTLTFALFTACRRDSGRRRSTPRKIASCIVITPLTAR